MNSEIFGHQNIKDLLNKQLANQTLAQAYLFLGPEGLGKTSLAEELARKILGAEKLANHPDFLLLDEPGEIPVEAVGQFTERLSLKPFVAKRKVAILQNAQNLNQHGSNALLKTLEEPNLDTIIILVSHSAKLLPTIVSRCQTFHFYEFSPEQQKDFAQARQLSITDEMLELSFGRPGRLWRLATDSEFFKQQQASLKSYQTFATQPLGEKMLAVASLAEAESGDLRRRILDWSLWQARRLEQAPADYLKLKSLLTAATELASNFNKKMVLQKLLSNL